MNYESVRERFFNLVWWGVMIFVALFAWTAQAQTQTQTRTKMTICHFPPGNPDNARTLSISPSAWPAHEAHGDFPRACQGGDEPVDPPEEPAVGTTIEPRRGTIQSCFLFAHPLRGGALITNVDRFRGGSCLAREYHAGTVRERRTSRVDPETWTFHIDAGSLGFVEVLCPFEARAVWLRTITPFEQNVFQPDTCVRGAAGLRAN